MADKKDVSYVILAETQNQGTWKMLGIVDVPAGSRSATAKRAGLANFQPEGGTVVAIPVADWTPEDLSPKLTFA